MKTPTIYLPPVLANFGRLLFLAALLAVPAAAAHADSITGSIGTQPASVDLDDYAAFAYYGEVGVAEYDVVSGYATTDATNIADFSNLVYNQDIIANFGPPDLSYSGATYQGNDLSGPALTAQENQTSAESYPFLNDPGVGGTMSFTTTLIAPTEEVSAQFFTFNGATTDFTASLTGGTGASLTPIDNVTQQADELNLFVTGSIGETLTVTGTVVSDPDPYGTIALDAVTVTVPEPPTYAMMFAGLAFLGFLVYRKSSRFQV